MVRSRWFPSTDQHVGNDLLNAEEHPNKELVSAGALQRNLEDIVVAAEELTYTPQSCSHECC